jgi:hypothetical protein
MGAALMNWGRAPNIARISAGRAPMSRRLLVTPPANPPGPFLQCVPMSRGRIRVPPHSAANRSATCLVGNDDGARVERTRFFLPSTANQTAALAFLILARASICITFRRATGAPSDRRADTSRSPGQRYRRRIPIGPSTLDVSRRCAASAPPSACLLRAANDDGAVVRARSGRHPRELIVGEITKPGKRVDWILEDWPSD